MPLPCPAPPASRLFFSAHGIFHNGSALNMRPRREMFVYHGVARLLVAMRILSDD